MRAASYSRRTVNLNKFAGINTEYVENLLPLNASPLSYNFTFEKGALQSNMGIDTAKMTSLTSSNSRHLLPSLPDGKSPKTIHVYRKYDFTNQIRADKLIVRTTDNNYYEIKLFEADTFHAVTNLTAVGKDCSVCYRYNGSDLFILCSEGGSLYTYDGTITTPINNAPKMTSMCVHAERVFATVSGEQNKVWFSDDFNPANWVVSGTGAGHISFDDEGGKVIKVVQFLNYVYVFRDFGIERVTAYGAQTDFSVSKIFMSSARIFPDTIVAMGDVITFMADDGLHVCDGYNVKAVAESLNGFLPIDKQNVVAAGLNGKYYFAADLNFGADNINPVLDEADVTHINDSLVEYDLSKGSFSILRGADISGLTAVKVHTEASVLMTFRGGNNTKIGRFVTGGKYFSAVLPKYWTTGYTDLGYPSRKKTVREISLVTSCDVTLGVEMDGQASEYPVTGGKLPSKIIINRSGARMRVYVKTSAANITAITPPSVVVDIV